MNFTIDDIRPTARDLRTVGGRFFWGEPVPLLSLLRLFRTKDAARRAVEAEQQGLKALADKKGTRWVNRWVFDEYLASIGAPMVVDRDLLQSVRDLLNQSQATQVTQ